MIAVWTAGMRYGALGLLIFCLFLARSQPMPAPDDRDLLALLSACAAAETAIAGGDHQAAAAGYTPRFELPPGHSRRHFPTR